MKYKILLVSTTVNSDLRRLYRLKEKLCKNDIISCQSNDNSFNFPKQKNRLINVLNLTNWTTIKRNLVEIRRMNITHVIFDDDNPIYLVYGIVLKISGKKLIYTVHDQVPHEGKGYLIKKIYQKIVINLLATELLIFGKNELKTSTKKVTKVILGGYEGENHSENHYRKGKILKVIIFGRIKKYKGYNHLKVITEMVRDFPIKFTICGDGDGYLLNDLRDQVNVDIIQGYIPDDELKNVFSETDVNLLTYNTGTQSGVALLASSFGVPTLSFSVGGIKEYIDRGIGKTIEPYDYSEMAKELISYCKMPEEKMMDIRRRTLKSYSENYSEDAFILQYKNIFERIISSSNHTNTNTK